MRSAPRGAGRGPCRGPRARAAETACVAWRSSASPRTRCDSSRASSSRAASSARSRSERTRSRRKVKDGCSTFRSSPVRGADLSGSTCVRAATVSFKHAAGRATMRAHGTAHQPHHARRRRPAARDGLLRRARLGGHARPTATSPSSRPAAWSSRSGTARKLAEDSASRTAAAGAASRSPTTCARRRRSTRSSRRRAAAGGRVGAPGARDVLGRLLRRLPRPRRAPVGGRPQPGLDDRGGWVDVVWTYAGRCSSLSLASGSANCKRL